MIFFPLRIYAEARLLHYVVALFLNSWGNSVLFSTENVAVYIPTSSAPGFPFLHSLTSICSFAFLITDIPTGVRWHLIVFLICAFLQISDVKYSFMYWLAIYMFFVCVCVKNVLSVLCLFFNFLCVGGRGLLSVLCILDINSLSGIPFANIFSYTINCFWFC